MTSLESVLTSGNASLGDMVALLQVTAIEPNPNPTRTQTLHGDSRVTVIHTTIEEFSETLPPRFDAVVLTPPFALKSQPKVWISPVLTAWDLLAPGAGWSRLSRTTSPSDVTTTTTTYAN